MRHMKPITRGKVMLLCLCLFALSAATAALGEETAILLLIASSGTFVLVGLVDDSKKDRLADSSFGNSRPLNKVNGLRQKGER